MHDPLTVAFEIKYPWRHYSRAERKKATTPFDKEWRRTYRNSFITIWHKDPELHGSDDSCGWFTPRFSQETKDICKTLAGDEAREPWFMARSEKSISDPILCERLLFGAFMLVSRCLVNRGVMRREVTTEEATRWASMATHNSIDNFRNSLSFLSGYHSNWYKDGIPNTEEQDKFWREEQARSFFGAIAGWILRDRRHWFQKPRWHVWHWRFQIHPLQKIRRLLFDRCEMCGKRFAYGETPCGSWSGDKVWHMGCAQSANVKREIVSTT
jgi:hypothetical protein